MFYLKQGVEEMYFKALIISALGLSFPVFCNVCNAQTGVYAEKPKLVLYYRPNCPYCVKVITYIKKERLKVEFCNISTNSAALETLIRVGGKKQVPCLFIDGKPLYESDEIIKWLDRRKSSLR